MKSMSMLCGVLLVAASMTGVAPVDAQEDAQEVAASPEAQARLGGLTFREYCRSCHGPEARGDGPVAQYLSPKPADLTRIAQRSKGEFPSDAVSAAISGGKTIKGHGNSEMPVWGEAFLKIRKGQTEQEVKERIAQLVLYLKSIQIATEPPN